MASTIEQSREDEMRQVPAMMRYVDEGDFVTRRYVSAGQEMNTGTYSDHEIIVRDAMPIREHFTLDTHGFMIAKAPSAITDFHDKPQVEANYEREVEQHIMRLTGADKCVARGWMIRTSADLSKAAEEEVENYQHSGGTQPPAGEAHVDINTFSANRMAEHTYRQEFPNGPGFKRFLVSSFWRTFSPPPQDVPLALCDGRTSFGGEEKNNSLHVVDKLPSEEEALLPIADEEKALAATIFSHHPNHRWWYFSGMEADDALLFKFHDSDHDRTWRCPHSAFNDSSAKGGNIRESVEVRSVAFWE